MVIIRKSELKKMSKEELLKKLKELREELMKIKSQTEMKRPIKNTGRIREIRRTIARILTMLNK
ncbi:MAG: 50S ribosomal protein L29 [Candidatus Aenigmatarchaeota archaeon]